MSTDEMDINAIAMGVILNAGDARMCIDEAMDALASMDFEVVDAKIAEADAKIMEAHKAQTETIQRQAAGEEVEYSLLFTHAQDTLMTISAELHMTKKMLPVVQALAAR